MHTEETRKLFTVDDYNRMYEVGIIKREDRTELIAGEIIQMSSMGLPHRSAVLRVNDFLTPLFKGKAQISVQIPLDLDAFNEPQPDICFLKPSKDFYRSRAAGPEDVLLILEIADNFVAIRPRTQVAGIRIGSNTRAMDIESDGRNPAGLSQTNPKRLRNGPYFWAR
jgi:Uma2 family endonuclease